MILFYFTINFSDFLLIQILKNPLYLNLNILHKKIIEKKIQSNFNKSKQLNIFLLNAAQQTENKKYQLKLNKITFIKHLIILNFNY